MSAIGFTHLVLDERSAFEETDSLSDWVEEHWGDALKRFASCQSLKRVYLFLANAYQAHLVYLSKPEKKEHARLASQREDLIRREIRAYLRTFAHTKKFVIVGLNELLDFLSPMEELSKNSADVDLNSLFLGQGQNIFYDCPKVVEALIRIARRNEDPNIPILRFDEDVKVSEEAVAALITEYRIQKRRWLYYFFSGTYDYHTLDNPRYQQSPPANPEELKAQHLINDSSVRVHFLSHHAGADIYSYLSSQGFPTDGSAFALHSKAIFDRLKDQLADQFTLDLELADAFLEIVEQYGANLKNQPISGAGLCISPMAIVQLPPFANVATQIVWIDDDLKRRLHLGIGDLHPDQDCSVRGASFEQNRHDEGIKLKDVLWGYSSYLPRVATGCLMNALMYDPNTTTHGAFATTFERYMRDRTKATPADREGWAREAITRLTRLRDAICDHPVGSNPHWKPLADFAKHDLTYEEPKHGAVVDSIVRDPDQNVAQLCVAHGLAEGRHAAAYIAEVVSDLHRYIELVDLWPYIVRTLDFLVRNADRDHWLKSPELL